MTQTQEQKLKLAVDMYRLRLEQARVDLAGYMMNLKKKLDKDAHYLNKDSQKQKLAEQAMALDEMAMILTTEEPELGFDKGAFFFDLFEGKESVYG